MFCIWRGERERCHYALVRREFNVDEGIQQLVGVHAMFVDNTGSVQFVRYGTHFRTGKGELRPTLGLAVPTSIRNTVVQMAGYFKRRLLLTGGHPRAYEALGLQRPVVTTTTTVDPKSELALSELYVRAAKLLELPEPELRKKYAHLNRGLQAMNLRNRLRAKGHNV